MSTLRVVLLAGLLCCAHAFALDLPALVVQARPGVVGVGTFEALGAPRVMLTGTGFLIGDGTLAVTNHHVAVAGTENKDRARQLVVFIGRGKSPEVRPARIVAEDRFHDLAILRLEGSPRTALPLARVDEVVEGQSIAIIGFPIGAVLGLYPSTNAGIVSAISPIAIPQATTQTLSTEQIRRLRDPFEIYQLDLIAYPGNSGSPVFDVRTGEIIGVVNAVVARKSKEAVLKDPSAITYAIPIKHVRALLATL